MSHKKDSNVTTWGRAGAAGLSESPERQASAGPTQEILLPWLCRAPLPCGHFPELLQEEAMYFKLCPIKDVYSIMLDEECTPETVISTLT